MKPWTPVIFSFLVIISSIVIIRSDLSNSISSSFISSSPLSSKPTIAVLDDYLQTYAKCGELPILPEYSSNTFSGDYSIRTWSPSCLYISWSATIKTASSETSISPYEGLFLYDTKTQKVTRLYTPQSNSDTVIFKKWQTDTTFIFHKNIDNSDYLYNVSTQSIIKN
jgi:hypothetical protein